jgi:hypothetical protein
VTGRPDVIPCERDPDFECVRLGSQAAGGAVATPPGESAASGGEPLCPEGYVPRHRRRSYRLEGKVVRRDEPPTRNAG